MKGYYRGYEINVKRERCLGGWTMLYFFIVRESDGYMPVDAFEDSDEPVREKMRQMKQRIDAELESEDPWAEDDDGSIC